MKITALLIAVAVAGCSSAAPAGKPQARTAGTSTIATGLHVPWGIDFLPNGDALVAERTTGKIVRIHKGRKSTAMRVPGVDTNAGEGGLLGLAVSPDYAKDGLVYAYFTSTSGDNRIVRFKLGGSPQPILTGLKSGAIHDGGRIAFGPDGKLYAGVGETGDPPLAQDEGSQNGKILRMNPDGSVPSDNPIAGSRVWTLGHRNVQGLAWDRAGRMWASEFGQDTTDEVNLIEKGKNYGWPDVEGKGDTRGGKFTNPLVTWSPTSTSSPSGAVVIGSNLYVAALQGHGVWKIRINGASLGKPRLLFRDRYGRVRTVVKAPNGALWLATSNTDGRGEPESGDDRIVQVKPAP